MGRMPAMCAAKHKGNCLSAHLLQRYNLGTYAVFSLFKAAGYGAAAKGNTLMNYAGIRPDLISFVVDRNPAKLGKYLPGSRIPITDETRLQAIRPDYVIILPWNIRDEIQIQLAYIVNWGGRFVTAVPDLRVYP